MKKTYTLIFLISAAIFFIDQVTKLFIISRFEVNDSVPIIKNFFHLTFVTNTGSAFGMLKDSALLLIFFSIVVLFSAIYYSRKITEKEKWMQVALGLLIGGTLGNLLDRFIYGYVIDFLDFRIWPVFNIADSSITISAAILIMLIMKK